MIQNSVAFQDYCRTFSDYYTTYALKTIFHNLVRSPHDQVARINISYKLSDSMETLFNKSYRSTETNIILYPSEMHFAFRISLQGPVRPRFLCTRTRPPSSFVFNSVGRRLSLYCQGMIECQRPTKLKGFCNLGFKLVSW